MFISKRTRDCRGGANKIWDEAANIPHTRDLKAGKVTAERAHLFAAQKQKFEHLVRKEEAQKAKSA